MKSDLSDTLSLDQVILMAIRQELVNTFTSIPAKVVKVNKNLVTVEITLTRKVLGKTTKYPLVHNVPLRRECTDNESYLHFPISKGTTGLLIFAQRSLDKWIDSDGVTLIDPDSTRIHDISDATFWPGLLTNKKVIRNDKNVRLVHKLSSLEMSENGTFELTGKSGGLIDTTEAVASNVDNITTHVLLAFEALNGLASGALTPIIEAIESEQSELQANIEKLNGMKL